MLNVLLRDTLHFGRRHLHKDFHIVLEYMPFRLDSRCSARIVVDNMVDFQYNFLHMSKLGDLVAIRKSRMDRTAMASMDFRVVVVPDVLRLDCTLQMDYQFHLDYSCRLGYG